MKVGQLMKCFCKVGIRAVSVALVALLALVPVGAAADGLTYTEYETINEYLDHYEEMDASFFDDVENAAVFVMDTIYQVGVFSFGDNDYSEFERHETDETGVFYALKDKELFGCKTTLTVTPYSASNKDAYTYKKSNIEIYLTAETEEQNHAILNSLAQVMRLLESNGGYSFIFLNDKMVSAKELVNYLDAGEEVESLSYSLSVDKFQFSLSVIAGSVSFGCTLDYAA